MNTKIKTLTVKLSDAEKRMREGEEGPGVRKAMELLVAGLCELFRQPGR